MIRPLARLHHAAQHGLGQAEDGLQVGRHDRVPLVVLHPQQQVVARDAGIVDEDRDGAVFRLDGGEHGVRRRGVGDVELHPGARVARLAAGTRRSSRRLRPSSRCRRPSRRPRRARSAMARPMPRVAPVTSAVCPASCPCAMSLLLVRRALSAASVSAIASLSVSAIRVDAVDDAPAQSGQHLARAAFDDVRDALLGHCAGPSRSSAPGLAACRASALRIASGVGVLGHVDVVNHRDRGRRERDLRQALRRACRPRASAASCGTVRTPAAARRAWRPSAWPARSRARPPRGGRR